MTSKRWVITPFGLLTESLKRELQVTNYEQQKLENAVSQAMQDLKDFMRKSHKTDKCCALVLDNDDDMLKFISVEKIV